MNKPEFLRFEYQQQDLSRAFIQSREHLILYIKLLAKKYNIPANKIIFNHDNDKQKDENFFFLKNKNFAIKGSYDFIKSEVMKK